MNEDSPLQDYFREAESWDADRMAHLRRSARAALWAAAAGWTCAVAAATALVVLMPLKRVEPFVVRVDNSTGVVDVVPIYDGRATPQEAVTRYFLTHYSPSASDSILPPQRATTRSAARFIRLSETRRGMPCGRRPTRPRR